MKMRHVRIDKDVRIADAVTFRAGDRTLVESKVAGTSLARVTCNDLICDTFTIGEALRYWNSGR